MTGSQLQDAIAIIWDEVVSDLGSDSPEFERRLTQLLRDLDADPDSSELVKATFSLFDQFPASRKRLDKALELVLVGSAKAGGVTGILSERFRFTTVRVLYGTSRAYSGDPELAHVYSGERASNTFGIAEVSIPDDHRMGRLEKPKWFKLQFRPDPEKHVLLLGLETLDRDAFIVRTRNDLAGADKRDLLLFVHGFNVSFEDSARRAAQIAYDLHFQGIPALYSWPSEGSVAKYLVDANNASWAEPHFVEFLKLLRHESGANMVHIVAHSMGTRLVANTLATATRGEAPAGSALNQVVFAAPDIDADTFRNLAKAFPGKAERITLYASSNDQALVASRAIQKYPRAGQSGLDLVVVPAVDTVDATAMKTDLLGHSYYGDNRSIISDMFELIRKGTPPGDRPGLSRKELYGAKYWAFSP